MAISVRRLKELLEGVPNSMLDATVVTEQYGFPSLLSVRIATNKQFLVLSQNSVQENEKLPADDGGPAWTRTVSRDNNWGQR